MSGFVSKTTHVFSIAKQYACFEKYHITLVMRSYSK